MTEILETQANRSAVLPAAGQQFISLTNVRNFKGVSAPLNILLLADDRHEANVVQDHINAFRLHSTNNIFVVNPIWQNINRVCDLKNIDLILIHYSILILSEYFLPEHNAETIRNFPGPKAQIIQDEYRWVNRMKARISDLGISAVFSSLNTENMQKVYAGSPLGGVSFYGCLPGYVPEHMKNVTVSPIADRPLDIVYRGRDLPFWFGKQGREKFEIGQHMLRLCGQYGGLIDISAAEDRRIYGNEWLKFIASGRATLGVQGGVSIFDFDEKVQVGSEAYLEQHPDASFDEVFENVLKPYEGNIVHRTITPRIFETIALKTALILYPGEYSGILDPEKHYILFEPDGSNNAEVAEKLRDHQFLQQMVDRTYSDIIDKPKLQSSFFVAKVDAVLARLTTTKGDKKRKDFGWSRWFK